MHIGGMKSKWGQNEREAKMTSGLQAKRKFCDEDSTKLKLPAPATKKWALLLPLLWWRHRWDFDFVALHTWIVGRWNSATAEEPKGRVLYV